MRKITTFDGDWDLEGAPRCRLPGGILDVWQLGPLAQACAATWQGSPWLCRAPAGRAGRQQRAATVLAVNARAGQQPQGSRRLSRHDLARRSCFCSDAVHSLAPEARWQCRPPVTLPWPGMQGTAPWQLARMPVPCLRGPSGASAPPLMGCERGYARRLPGGSRWCALRAAGRPAASMGGTAVLPAFRSHQPGFCSAGTAAQCMHGMREPLLHLQLQCTSHPSEPLASRIATAQHAAWPRREHHMRSRPRPCPDR